MKRKLTVTDITSNTEMIEAGARFYLSKIKKFKAKSRDESAEDVLQSGVELSLKIIQKFDEAYPTETPSYKWNYLCVSLANSAVDRVKFLNTKKRKGERETLNFNDEMIEDAQLAEPAQLADARELIAELVSEFPNLMCCLKGVQSQPRFERLSLHEQLTQALKLCINPHADQKLFVKAINKINRVFEMAALAA